MKKENLKKERKIYDPKLCFVVLLEKDKFELPLLSAGSLIEISEFLQIPLLTITTAISRKRLLNNKYRIMRVNVSENKYQEYGYADRKDYLHSLAVKYGISETTVKVLANTLGEDEDFNQLVSMCENISKEGA